MKQATPVSAADLFVVLERAFRRQARECDDCVFTLPYRVARERRGDANWAVIPFSCSETCRLILEDLVEKHQATYCLAESPASPAGI